MTVRFIHTSDLHLGKTYRHSPGESERFDDFFRTLAAIAADAVTEAVDFFLIAGDLFHTGQILPKTFARTIETLQPLKDAGIPCIAVEGNHDWIHRRDSISWMEALSHMGYLKLLRPGRTDNGGYRFDPFRDGHGGRIEIAGVNIYGLGYIGSQSGSHVARICDAVTTDNNILLLHAGLWTYSPVEIGNMKPEEAAPLADTFRYVALGHGHKPYIVKTPEGRPYAYNPGAPERVSFGEERYDKGYFFVTLSGDDCCCRFRETSPRPMLSLSINLDGVENADAALDRFRTEIGRQPTGMGDRRPLLELRLTGRVPFHSFELGRERLCLAVQQLCNPLHVEIRNHLSLLSRTGSGEGEKRSLAEIEREVLGDLIASGSGYRHRQAELVRLSLAIRDLVMKGEIEGEELLALLDSSTGVDAGESS